MTIGDSISKAWDYDDPVGTEQRLRALQDNADAYSDSDRAEILSQIARNLGLMNNGDEAKARIAQGLGLAPPGSRGEIRCHLELGRIANTCDQDTGRALECFEAALALAKKSGEDGLAVDAMHMIAIVSPALEGIVWNQRALELAENSDDPDARRWRASLLNNLAWGRLDICGPEVALPYFKRAHSLRIEAGKGNEERIARYAVGKCIRLGGDALEALELQMNLLADHARAGTGVGFVEEEIAECLLTLDRLDEASLYFGIACRKLSDSGQLDEFSPRLLRMSEYANLARP